MSDDPLHQEIILDHYRHPRGRGLRTPYEAQVHHVNPTCGDEIDLRVHLAKDGDGRVVVSDVSYDGQGCSISQASASVLAEQLVGLSLGDALMVQQGFTELMQSRGTLTPDEDLLGDGIAFAGVSKYPARVKCALLAWMAWRDAVSQAVDIVVEGKSGE
jgi:nitrogen fixation NifU-like protein